MRHQTLIIPDIVRCLPEVRQVVTDGVAGHVLLVYTYLLDQLQLKKLWNVDDGGDDKDRYDVHEDPGGDAPHGQGVSVVERMTDRSVPDYRI